MKSFRVLLLPLLLSSLLVPLGHSASAQQKPAAEQQPALSPEQARAALDTLNDPKKRAAFTATLEALLKSQPAQPVARPLTPPIPPVPPAGPGAAPGGAPGGAPGAEKESTESLSIPLAPNSLGAQILLTASEFVAQMSDAVMAGVHTAQSLPLLWGWVVVMVTNPLGQRLLTEAGWRLGAALAISAALAFGARSLLRRPMRHLLRRGQHAPPDPGSELDAEDRAELGDFEPPPRRGVFNGASRRLTLGLGRLGLEMVPVLVLLIAGHVLSSAPLLGGTRDTSLIVLAGVEAVAVSMTLLSLLTFLFQPEPPGLRLASLPPRAGAYLVRWGKRIVLIVVPGYTVGEIGLLLGLSTQAHDAWQKTIGLLLTICLAVIIVQQRRTVRRWLSAGSNAGGHLARLRTRLAHLWHWAALFILITAWMSWTLGAPDAIASTLRYFAVTAGVVAGASILQAVIDRIPGQLHASGGEAHPVRERLSAYHPAIRRVVRTGVNILALLVLLQFYGLGGLHWLLTTDVGKRVASGLVTLTVTIGLAIAVWEIVNLAIQSHLEYLRQQGQTTRLARVRTLLPLVRTALAITVAVVAGLMILSEIGVNIAPLLAGAGIVGVAIGFGSQKLVQDVITGVFLLLENTMQVGDIVRVGDQTGAVESLSVRTIRLRTDDGSVVVIPFSSVTTVVNMTRDFSRAVVNVSVGIRENVDRVMETMKDIVREMRSESAWSGIILDDLELFGVDKITDNALLIKGRVRCTPFGRWSVGREFNRRLQDRFTALGIAAPDSVTRLLLDPGQRFSMADPGVARSQARGEDGV